jgi:hypothetical protein
MKNRLKRGLAAMNNIIRESGMDFIADNAFHIEKSPLYKNIGGGVKSVEFVRAMKNNKLIFVEAKTAFPNPKNPSEGSLPGFRREVDEICKKFAHSLNLYSSVEVGAAEEKFPKSYAPPSRVSLIFVLVIKNHRLEWCKRIVSKLNEVMPPYIKAIWKPKILVINQEMAEKYNLTVQAVKDNSENKREI